jgi:hypothetical protein
MHAVSNSASFQKEKKNSSQRKERSGTEKHNEKLKNKHIF